MNTNSFFTVEEVVRKNFVVPAAAPDSEESIDVTDNGLAVCPMCNQQTLRVENGCHSCINEECGYSKCDM